MTSPTPVPGTSSSVLSIRIADALLAQLTAHAARRGLPLQDYVLRILAREDFDERFHSSVQRSALLARGVPTGPSPGEGPPHSPGGTTSSRRVTTPGYAENRYLGDGTG